MQNLDAFPMSEMRAPSAGIPVSPARDVPLFVDLDGTLIHTDSLLEYFLLRVKHRPSDLLRMPFWLLRGKAHLKTRLAEENPLDVGRLPFREDFVEYLRREHAAGRRIYLATGAHHSLAQSVADHFGFFDGILASDANVSLTGKRKLAAIRKQAPEGFAYAANSRADLVVWRAAKSAILVNTSRAVAREAQLEQKAEVVFERAQVRLSEWLYAIRVHQWMKNLLVFVALLTSFRMHDSSAVLEALMAFIAFSLCASSVYVVNDLLDLEADRAHPRKRFRPFASGRISILHGVGMAALTMIGGLGLAYIESAGLFAVIIIYLATTTAYTWTLKKRALLDVVTLALLYALRIAGGAVAIGVPVSVWLLAFALFLFLSLALAKRCSELISMQRLGLEGARGRGYRVDDLNLLWSLGMATGVCSVVVFALFVADDDLPHYYAAPSLLWFVALALFYWLSYVWMKTSRGEMFDDPMVFAVKDRGSRMAIAVAIAITLAARFVHLPDSALLVLR